VNYTNERIHQIYL
jgi:myosin heavy subunit